MVKKYKFRKYSNFIFLYALVLIAVLTICNDTAFAITKYSNQGSDDFQTVWDQVSRFFGGYGGKLAALGIIAASVLVRERIGIPMMILGIVAGMMLPSLPAIVDNFTIILP